MPIAIFLVAKVNRWKSSSRNTRHAVPYKPPLFMLAIVLPKKKPKSHSHKRRSQAVAHSTHAVSHNVVCDSTALSCAALSYTTKFYRQTNKSLKWLHVMQHAMLDSCRMCLAHAHQAPFRTNTKHAHRPHQHKRTWPHMSIWQTRVQYNVAPFNTIPYTMQYQYTQWTSVIVPCSFSLSPFVCLFLCLLLVLHLHSVPFYALLLAVRRRFHRLRRIACQQFFRV